MVEATQTNLELGARHAEVVRAAIQHWVRTSTISDKEASLLAETISVQTFDWEKFAKYSLRFAILFLAVAVVSVVFEDSFIRIYKRVVALPASLRSASTAIVAIGIHILAHRRSQAIPEQIYANEAIHAVGALCLLLAAIQAMMQLDDWAKRKSRESDSRDPDDKTAAEEGDKNSRGTRRQEHEAHDRLMGRAMYGIACSLATAYGTVGLVSKSNFIWSCAMIVLSYCCGGMSGYLLGMYWLYVESPLLFVGMGSFLVGVAHLMQSHEFTAPLSSTTRIWGLLYFFIALWILSIGGYDDYMNKSSRRFKLSERTRIALWSLLFAAAAAGSVVHGLRLDDSTTKGFGLTFLGINLYTKFFQICWKWPKSLFFAILAGSFALIGKYAENVWNMHLATLR